MRDIKFRGRRQDIGWKYGYLTCVENKALTGWEQKPAIRPFDELFITYGVDPDTIGEYTGLKDKQGREIYEGDIVQYHGEYFKETANVVWYGTGSWGLHNRGKYLDELIFSQAIRYDSFSGKPIYTEMEVIGNIYEHPELLALEP